MKPRKFLVKEEKGDLSYSVIWISADGRLKEASFRSWDDAITHFSHLKTLGRQPSVSLNITQESEEENKKKGKPRWGLVRWGAFRIE